MSGGYLGAAPPRLRLAHELAPREPSGALGDRAVDTAKRFLAARSRVGFRRRTASGRDVPPGVAGGQTSVARRKPNRAARARIALILADIELSSRIGDATRGPASRRRLVEAARTGGTR